MFGSAGRTQLYAGDAQRPDVHLAVVLALVHGQDHLWSHPTSQHTAEVNQRFLNRVVSFLNPPRSAKAAQLQVSISCKLQRLEDVCGFMGLYFNFLSPAHAELPPLCII